MTNVVELSKDERSALAALAGSAFEHDLRTKALERKAQQRREIRARAKSDLEPAERALAAAGAARLAAEREHQRILARAESSLAALRSAWRDEIGAEAHRDAIAARQHRELSALADERVVQLATDLAVIRRMVLGANVVETARKSRWTLRGPMVEVQTSAELTQQAVQAIAALLEDAEYLALRFEGDDPADEIARIRDATLVAIEPLARHGVIVKHELPDWGRAQ